MNAQPILIALATYNELENLPNLLREIWEAIPQADVLVIDDNSPDGTGRWCERYAAEERRLRVMHRPCKMGLGSAILGALQYAADHNYRFVVTMDADFSHRPNYLPELIGAMEPVVGPATDVAIGSRYVKDGRIEGWPWYRRAMSRAINLYTRWLLRLPVRDCSSGFRCYRVGVLEQLDLHGLSSTGYSFLEEILWHLKAADARFVEIPITFFDRTRGKSKINWREAASAVLLIARLAVAGKPALRRQAR